MEPKHMRRILAEAMGWTRRKHHGRTWWLPPGKDGHLKSMPLEYWRPDTDWSQCGLVIEAMRERGWHIELHQNPRDCVMWRGTGDDQTLIWVVCDETCEAIATALAKALEATDD